MQVLPDMIALCGADDGGILARPRAARNGFQNPLSEDLSPNQLDALGDHIADGQQGAGPYKGRGEIGDLKSPERHLEDAGNERYGSPQRSEEATDEDSKRSPLFDEPLAARN